MILKFNSQTKSKRHWTTYISRYDVALWEY